MAEVKHTGHRKRLDDRTKRFGFEFLEEHEQLEKILFAVIPRGNTNEIAYLLINQFGSLYGVLTAEVDELAKIPGVGKRTAQFLHDLYPILGCVERCKQRKIGAKVWDMQTPELRGRYTKTLFYGNLTEAFYLVSLNKRLQAFRFDKISNGNEEETPVYIKEVVKLAMRNNAYAVVLCHNHPSGMIAPSHSDIETTQQLKQALEAVELQLIDHIIVGGGEYLSLKELGLI